VASATYTIGVPPPGLTIQSPANNSTVSSPVTVQATDPKASTMQVWVDYQKVYEINATSINTKLTLATGTHRFVVQSLYPGGTSFKVVESITVK
jgi:hypothetical protein